MRNLIDSRTLTVVQLSSRGKLTDLYVVLEEDKLAVAVNKKTLDELMKNKRA